MNRDHLDVGSEMFMADYKSGNYYAYEANEIELYLKFYNDISKILCKKMPETAMQVCFEQLTEDPVATIESISSFMSLSFNIKSLENYKKRKYAYSPLREHFKKLVGQ